MAEVGSQVAEAPGAGKVEDTGGSEREPAAGQRRRCGGGARAKEDSVHPKIKKFSKFFVTLNLTTYA